MLTLEVTDDTFLTDEKEPKTTYTSAEECQIY